jgi:hypothetical protein
MAGAESRIQLIQERQPGPEENEGRRQALARCSGELELTSPSESIAEMGPDEDPPCRCVRVEVDVDDARDCPLHGPASEVARRAHQREADDIAAFYAQSPFSEEPG